MDFFHTNALSPAVAMEVDCDLQLTLMASSLYRLLGEQIGKGYASAKSKHIFRDFINAVANAIITEREIVVRFQKCAHNSRVGRLRNGGSAGAMSGEPTPSAGLRIVPMRHGRIDWRRHPHRSTGSETGATSNSMLGATPGVRRIRPLQSRVINI